MLYDCMNLNPVKYNLESMGHCLSYNNSCVLHPICCSGGNSVAFVKFFKNHTVFYMAQLLLALIFVILFDTQFFPFRFSADVTKSLDSWFPIVS